jgi:hypothetical protein
MLSSIAVFVVISARVNGIEENLYTSILWAMAVLAGLLALIPSDPK